MKTYRLDPSSFEKFIHQNGAELIDFYEGCLLDNYLFTTKHGATLAIYEHYLNANSSDYHVYFSKDQEEAATIENSFIICRDNKEASA